MDYQEFSGAVGRLNKSICGLFQAGRCWNLKITNDLKTLGLEQSPADPCVFRNVVGEEGQVVAVIHVGNK